MPPIIGVTLVGGMVIMIIPPLPRIMEVQENGSKGYGLH